MDWEACDPAALLGWVREGTPTCTNCRLSTPTRCLVRRNYWKGAKPGRFNSVWLVGTANSKMALIPPLTEYEQKGKPLRVCVTGATGYLAGHIVQRLLAAGHTVHGTARQPSSNSSTKHLLAMPGAVDRLKLFKADLLEPGAFDEAVAGCDVVIHTASPYLIQVPKGEAGPVTGYCTMLPLQGCGRPQNVAGYIQNCIICQPQP